MNGAAIGSKSDVAWCGRVTQVAKLTMSDPEHRMLQHRAGWIVIRNERRLGTLHFLRFDYPFYIFHVTPENAAVKGELETTLQTATECSFSLINRSFDQDLDESDVSCQLQDGGTCTVRDLRNVPTQSVFRIAFSRIVSIFSHKNLKSRKRDE